MLNLSPLQAQWVFIDFHKKHYACLVIRFREIRSQINHLKTHIEHIFKSLPANTHKLIIYAKSCYTTLK
ncbi:hypothetical protein D3C71_809830 [compost metagenome]